MWRRRRSREQRSRCLQPSPRQRRGARIQAGGGIRGSSVAGFHGGFSQAGGGLGRGLCFGQTGGINRCTRRRRRSVCQAGGQWRPGQRCPGGQWLGGCKAGRVRQCGSGRDPTHPRACGGERGPQDHRLPGARPE
jgi:hypothetical protein